VSTRPNASVAFMLRALRYRNYRLFFGGQIVSLAGSWITTTATSWLVYRLTGSKRFCPTSAVELLQTLRI